MDTTMIFSVETRIDPSRVVSDRDRHDRNADNPLRREAVQYHAYPSSCSPAAAHRGQGSVLHCSIATPTDQSASPCGVRSPRDAETVSLRTSRTQPRSSSRSGTNSPLSPWHVVPTPGAYGRGEPPKPSRVRQEQRSRSVEDIVSGLSERDQIRMVNLLAQKTSYTLLREDERAAAEELYTQAQEDLRNMKNYKDQIASGSAEKDRTLRILNQELAQSQEIAADTVSERDRRIHGMAQAQASMSGQISLLSQQLRGSEEECHSQREEVVYHRFEQQSLETRLAESKRSVQIWERTQRDVSESLRTSLVEVEKRAEERENALREGAPMECDDDQSRLQLQAADQEVRRLQAQVQSIADRSREEQEAAIQKAEDEQQAQRKEFELSTQKLKDDRDEL